MDYLAAKTIMGVNFIGPAELDKIKNRLGIASPLRATVLPVPFSAAALKKYRRDFLLILGTAKTKTGQPLTINELRKNFGLDPTAAEPCFYNQDWYLKEKFASQTALANKWYLLKKTVEPKSQGQEPGKLFKQLADRKKPPLAILTAYAFFAYYLVNHGKKLWPNHFIWCADADHHGDQIYTGRYLDAAKINKNGFNVHRHLSIKKNYGLAPQIL